MAGVHWRTAAVLGVIWTANLLYCETLVFTFTKCKWPDLPYGGEGDKSLGRPARLALIGDPHMTGSFSYYQPGSPLVRLKQFYSDLYMRRAFRLSVLPSSPDTIVIMGNTLDKDSSVVPDGWYSIVERYNHVFDQTRPGIRRSSSGVRFVPIYSLYSDSIKRQLNASLTFETGLDSALEWVDDELGPQALNFTLGGAQIVAVNPKFLDGTEGHELAREAKKFVANLAADKDPLPRILLMPVPLSRTNRTSTCQRQYLSHAHQATPQPLAGASATQSESKSATEDVTQSLLDQLKPVHVFSGHDHRMCTIHHPSTEGAVTEETLGSFSGLDFATRPSFTMISIAAAPPHGHLSRGSVLAVSTCKLPSPVNAYLWYTLLYLASITLMVYPPFATLSLLWLSTRTAWALAFKREKLKNEDGGAEFDVMFDVEGGMHLVRKVESAPSGGPNIDQGQTSDRKGSAAVSRTTAKRPIGEEDPEITTAASLFAAERLPLMSSNSPAPTSTTSLTSTEPEKVGKGGGGGGSKVRFVGAKGEGASSSSSSAPVGASEFFWRYWRKGPWRGAVAPFLALMGVEFAVYMILVLKDWVKDV